MDPDLLDQAWTNFRAFCREYRLSGWILAPEVQRALGAIVEEMGEQLRRTAVSTNVKERLDFSCALLDSEGELVVNAPHIPVHLGSLGLCVRRLREVVEMRPGDVIATTDAGVRLEREFELW